MSISNSDSLTFSNRCYELLKKIPKGKITTYGEIARALNCQAYQAVGNAMRANPNPIVVPCHRVIKSNGDLGGYALGKSKKIELLTCEGVMIENGKSVDLKKYFYSFS